MSLNINQHYIIMVSCIYLYGICGQCFNFHKAYKYYCSVAESVGCLDAWAEKTSKSNIHGCTS